MTKIIEPPSEQKPKPGPAKQVRRSVRRLEGRSKVDGSVEYILNLTLPGMLYGKKPIQRAVLTMKGLHGETLSLVTCTDGGYGIIRNGEFLNGCQYSVAADLVHVTGRLIDALLPGSTHRILIPK